MPTATELHKGQTVLLSDDSRAKIVGDVQTKDDRSQTVTCLVDGSKSTVFVVDVNDIERVL